MSAGSRTVLVVDDDREVQRFLADRLEREGFRVLTEKDGEWALKAFERREIDALVLDILIPVVSGFQVAEQIRASARGRDVGIIMLTGIYRGPRHRQEAIERYHLLDYLLKPVDADRVVELLRHHFETATRSAVSPLPAPPPTPPAALVDERQHEEQREVERASASAASAPPHEGDPLLRGNLKALPFPELLAEANRRRLTGGLFLLRDKIKKIVYFRDGHPGYIKSNVLDECLGRVLVRERMITERECEESVRRMKANKRQQGSILIEMGVISPHNLRFGLELQLQVKLFDIFRWTEAEYVFRQGIPFPGEVISLEMSNAQIVLEGVKSAYDERRLEEALAPILGRYLQRVPDPELRFQDLGLSLGEEALVEGIDGLRATREVLETAPGSVDRRDAMALLYGLHAVGVLTAHDQPSQRLAPVAPPAPSAATREDWDDASLAAFLAARRGAHPRIVLGVAPAAPSDEIEACFAALARGLHPDRFRGRPVSTVGLAREAFDMVVRARWALVDPGKEPPPPPPIARDPTEDPASRALTADRHFQQGLGRLRAHAFAEAEHLFRQALVMRPDVGKYHAYYGWSVFCARGQAAEAAAEALASLEKGVELAPAEEEPHLFLGMVYNATDRPDLAEPEFEKALSCNPDSVDALRELRLLHFRRQSPA